MTTSDAGSTELRHRRRGLTATSLALCLMLVLVGGACSDDSSSDANTSSTPSGESGGGDADRVGGTITVSAAASLKATFTRIAEDFEKSNPGAEVSINFGSSGDLAKQMQSGAPVDVAAFASESDMQALTEGSLIDGAPEVFATNSLGIVTKPGNPKRVATLADLGSLAADGGTVSLCAETAPCGRYAAEVLRNADVTIPADRISRGQDVGATLAAVTEGDADAAIVYLTDATAAGDSVTPVRIPTVDNAVARYPIAVVAATKDAETAGAFMQYVLGPRGQGVLADAGFGAPPPPGSGPR